MRNEESSRRDTRQPVARSVLAVVTAMAFVCGTAAPSASEGEAVDEWKVKRKDVFEFEEKPVVTRTGDKVVVVFTAKDYCDATIAIENADGKIVRYLASGVLGPNAPEPFQKDTLKQTVVWDGKDDKGSYVDAMDQLTVRVSLGLMPRYERRLYWSPYRKSSYDAPAIVCPAPEGVYVFENGYPGHERLLFMDHQGNYIRQLYPFSAGMLPKIKGLLWRDMPQSGERLPLRNGLSQSTLLSTGDLDFNVRWPTAGGNSALAMAVRGVQIILADQRINRLATDGGTGGLDLQGPATSIPVFVPTSHAWRGGVVRAGPGDVAISPDGKWAYLAGYMWRRNWLVGGLSGVARVAMNGESSLEAFAGDLGRVAGSGKVEQSFIEGQKTKVNSDAKFEHAASVDVDREGRVFVADHGNDRIQVFDSAGKLLKSIPVKRPAMVRVSPVNGELFVFSWTLLRGANEPKNTVAPTLFRLGGFENPAVKAVLPLEIEDCGIWSNGPTTRAAVDFWTDPPTIWLAHPGRAESYVAGNPNKNGVRLLAEKDGKLGVLREFPKEAYRDTLRYLDVRLSRPRIYFNPQNGRLYAAEPPNPCVAYQKKEFKEAVVINPDSGKAETVAQLPFSAEDMAFDHDGVAYLRTKDLVARYDASTWHEIPFDYGEEKSDVAHTDVKLGKVISAIEMPSQMAGGWYHMGGMSVSVKGHLAVTCYNSTPVAADRRETQFVSKKETKPYTPRMYPGREPNWCVHVYDKYGRKLYEDAIPGSAQLSGIGIDRNDNLYAMTLGPRVYSGTPYDNVASCTVFKAKPQVTKFLSVTSTVPLPLEKDALPKRPPDIKGGPYGSAWIERAEWVHGGVGSAAKWIPFAGGGCWCEHSAMVLDEFARTFVPENDTYHIAVLDANGNLILRIGKYGNIDDGMPLIKEGGPPNPRSISGDEVALFLPRFCATDTDKRLFVSDAGHNCSILSVKLGYHAEERIPLGKIPDANAK